MKRLFNWWTVSIAAAILLALGLAVLMPNLVRETRPWWIRLLLVALSAAIWAGAAVWRLLATRMANDQIARELGKAEEAGDAEARVLAERMSAALKSLRNAGKGRDYLYRAPWYIIIGPSGAGKTHALLNSGLRFPYTDRAIEGVGGTRNLDFWFADEAVFIDTAGRYTTQDRDTEINARGWTAFLGLLRRHRPLQPINGVIVAMAIDELAGFDAAKLDENANAVRRRLEQLTATLKVRPPVYFLFTKVDLLGGFAPFFDDLEVEGRRAVLGATLPLGETSKEQLTSLFDELLQSLQDRQSKRLQNERNTARRGAIVAFPPQLASLRGRVLSFIDGACPRGGSAARVRGFYFASSRQDEGSTIDRLLGAAAQVFRRRADTERRGRAYFLNRLVTDVVLPEAGLVQQDPLVDRRHFASLTLGGAVIATVTMLVIGLWLTSFFNNLAYEKALGVSGEAADRTLSASGVHPDLVSDGGASLQDVQQVLDQLRALPGGYEDHVKHRDHPLTSGFGLFADGPRHDAYDAYTQSLQRILLPRLVLRLQAVLRQPDLDKAATYEALKVYLSLVGSPEAAASGGREPLADWLVRHRNAPSITAWIIEDWTNGSLPGADNEAVREGLRRHLQALLALRPQAPWLQVAEYRNDGQVIDQARPRAAQADPVERGYAAMRSAVAEPDWRSGISPAEAVVFNDGGKAILNMTVPFFYTKEGYHKYYALGHLDPKAQVDEATWILGPSVRVAGLGESASQISSLIAGRYATDYTRRWEDVVNALRPADIFHDPRAAAKFTDTPSPIQKVLWEVVENTSLASGPGGRAASQAAARFDPRLMQAQRLGEAEVTASMQIDAGAQITNRFHDLATYAGNSRTPGSKLQHFIDAVRQAFLDTGAGTGNNGGLTATPEMKKAVNSLGLEAKQAPDMLETFMKTLETDATATSATTAQNSLAEAYAPLASACAAATENKYPFFALARDDADPAAVVQVFGSGRGFDRLTQDDLASMLDQTSPVWSWRAAAPGSAQLAPDSAKRLQDASRIRDLVSAPIFFQIEAASLGGGVQGVEMEISGARSALGGEPHSARQMSWSIQAASPHAEVRLLGADNKPVKEFDAEGPWSVFRLMDQARIESESRTAFKATFSNGSAFAVLHVVVRSATNPFARPGPWSFKCPRTL